MEAIECIKTRRSVRKFKPQAVPHDLIKRAVETASYSPSWKNSQIARYHVVENAETLGKIKQNALLGFVYNAETVSSSPCLVVLSYVKGRSGFERDGSYSTPKKDAWQMFDCGIAAQSFCLACHEEGLGSVIMGIFDGQRVAEIIDLDEKEEVAALIAVGFADETPDTPKRKSPDEILTFM